MIAIILLICFLYYLGLIILDKLRFKHVSPRKTVLITGAAQGLGKEIAFIYASKGCKVVIWDVCDQLFEELQKEIRAKSLQILLVRCDITSHESIVFALQKTLASVSKIDILINNAGISSNFLFEDMPTDRVLKTISVNLIGHTMVTKELLHMCDHFVTISSITSKSAFEKASDYCASKSAVEIFFRSLRLELKRKRSHKKVTVIYPYHIKTKMFEGFHVKNAPFFRSLEVNEAAEGVYKAICLEKEEVFLPSYIWISAYILEWLPSKIRDQFVLFLSDGAFENVKTR